MKSPTRPRGYQFHSPTGCGDNPNHGNQRLAEEKAVAISYNGLSHAVMLASPDALVDFAVGYSLNEGIVTDKCQIRDVETRHFDDAVCLDVTLNQRAFHQFKQARAHTRRTAAGSSACGLCGIEALEQVLSPPPIYSGRYRSLPPAAHLLALREQLNRAQLRRNTSGALHGAIYVDASGNSRVCREDVGRHNALDKVIGACARAGLSMSHGFIAISSRCGLELVQKATRCGIGTLVTLASPSDIAVRWARKYKLNLIHVPAQTAPRVYSSAEICPADKSVIDQLCEMPTV
ncbi:formate dehydrogenase accessory sulfurtransferase FdhD [Microbulbifer agarilyticus]|uniref:formate dehydrogenase accessory sulfurtransferase FdhD n=1 Tax=Microbulbifer agarilyticus TaxID=260552 RepID=UPI001C982658|nr:formate dehydrogenase accessory sulfurtransferase FdhD [Microbulbifer agarilyticus]MBY6189383.1 formate dehydrogenase accessory sulfurtransferase FdhD [Microbulbifer agarilyticus]